MAMPDLGTNLVTMFRRSAQAGGDRPFLWAKVQGTYQAWSWRRVEEEVRLIAGCLAQLGIAHRRVRRR